MRVLPHIKRLDDCFGDFLVRITCPCGASRHIEPEALARIAGANQFGKSAQTRQKSFFHVGLDCIRPFLGDIRIAIIHWRATRLSMDLAVDLVVRGESTKVYE